MNLKSFTPATTTGNKHGGTFRYAMSLNDGKRGPHGKSIEATLTIEVDLTPYVVRNPKDAPPKFKVHLTTDQEWGRETAEGAMKALAKYLRSAARQLEKYQAKAQLPL